MQLDFGFDKRASKRVLDDHRPQQLIRMLLFWFQIPIHRQQEVTASQLIMRTQFSLFTCVDCWTPAIWRPSDAHFLGAEIHQIDIVNSDMVMGWVLRPPSCILAFLLFNDWIELGKTILFLAHGGLLISASVSGELSIISNCRNSIFRGCLHIPLNGVTVINIISMLRIFEGVRCSSRRCRCRKSTSWWRVESCGKHPKGRRENLGDPERYVFTIQ